MKFLDRIFGTNQKEEHQPSIAFGRYTDTYKTSAHYDAWDRSLINFENEAYLQAYLAFFEYLKDHNEKNVNFWEEKGKIHFEFFQGSKKITGIADMRKVKAEAKIAKTKALNTAFLQRLLNQNFDLKYSRYALDPENNIIIKFDSSNLDGSPYKMYYALKEVATSADKQDDLLLDEFGVLEPVDTGHLRPLPEHEKKIKYNYIIHEIKSILHELDHGKLDVEEYPGGIAYLFLNTSLKLDYLTRPEGFMMELLERLHRLYFAKDNKSTSQKIKMIRSELEQLLERPREDFFKEMYQVTSTFGITSPVNHDRVKGFINGELENMEWYYENGYHNIALSVPGYIVGYCLFNYAIPKPDRDFFHLYYQVTECEYFKQLGFTSDFYDLNSGIFNRKKIKQAIRRIVKTNEMSYPKLSPDIGVLNFQNLPLFSKSFLIMVRNLNMIKAD